MEEAVDDIVKSIGKAFRRVKRGSITLHEAEVIDVYGSDEERREARRKDSESHWKDIPAEHIQACHTALYHVDPVSWRFYLPAFLTWSLRYFRKSGSMSLFSTISNLDPGESSIELSQLAKERFQLLDSPQSHAVYLFLDYMSDHEEYLDAPAIGRALGNYWCRFSEA